MGKYLAGLLLLAIHTPAQTGSSLTSTLMRLHDRNASREEINRQAVMEILALKEKTSQVTPADVSEFASALTGALAGRQFDSSQISPVTSAVADVMQSAGMGAMAFQATVERCQKTLAVLGVSASRAESIAGLLEKIGKAVRGPEDLPLRSYRK